MGTSGEIFSKDASISPNSGESSSPIANIFGDNLSVSADSSSSNESASSEIQSTSSTEEKEEVSQSTEDLFAELFSEDELKKMEPVKSPDDEEEEELKSKAKSKMADIEFY